ERTVLLAASHGEVCPRARRCPDNPSTARYEIRTGRGRGRRSGRTGDIGMSRGDHDICDSVHYDVKRIHRDVTRPGLLLVDDHAAVRQRDRLVGRTAHDDRLVVVDDEPRDLRAAADRGVTTSTLRLGPCHEKASRDGVSTCRYRKFGHGRLGAAPTALAGRGGMEHLGAKDPGTLASSSGCPSETTQEGKGPTSASVVGTNQT